MISLGRFEAQMRYLAERRWQAVSMPELVGFMPGEALPARSVAIRFDDGWKSQLLASACLE